MSNDLPCVVKEFLKIHYLRKGPLLLGFSGGGDSLALLYLLKEIQTTFSFQLHLAHVDHGWRQESREQAEQLQKLAKQLELPFHLYTVIDQKQRNLEAEGRQVRLRFFSKIYREIGCEALLLAHHADDLAETILKKILEGAHMLALSGIKHQAYLEGMRVLRPLLTLSKKELQRWLTKKNLQGFDDETNREARFLRARMRMEILPQLAESFGKGVSGNLVRLGRVLEEIVTEMEEEMDSFLKLVQQGPFGSYLEIPSSLSSTKRDLLLKKFLNSQNIVLSYQSFGKILELLEKRSANRCFFANKRKVVVDRGIVFVLSRSVESMKQAICWEFKYEKVCERQEKRLPSWRDLWLTGKGEAVVSVAHESECASLWSNEVKDGQLLNRLWQERRVPAFFRSSVPVVVQSGKVIHEFLTGECLKTDNTKFLIMISLNFKLNNNYDAEKNVN